MYKFDPWLLRASVPMNNFEVHPQGISVSRYFTLVSIRERYSVFTSLTLNLQVKLPFKIRFRYGYNYNESLHTGDLI